MKSSVDFDEREYKHWATVVSEEAINKFGKEQVVATGWAPSGYYHIGNFKEAVTCRAIHHELKNLGAKSRFILNIDDVDPFDKVPAFFKKEYGKELKEYLGHAINQVPDPLGCHNSYAEHFIDNALEIMDEFDVNPEPIKTSEVYKQGKYDKYAKLFFEKQEEVFKLTEEITGSRMSEFILVQCPTCKNLAAPQIKSFEIKNGNIFVNIHCRREKGGCGEDHKLKLGETTWKLKWRLDWASRQDFFNVTVESSGKDHGVAGGSIDTALAIHERIFHRDPLPLLIQHGFLTFGGGKKLSGSSGSGLPVSEFPKILDPSVFLYQIYRHNLRTDFDFKVDTDVPKIAAEFDLAERLYFETSDFEHRKSKEKTIKAYELAIMGQPLTQPVKRVDYGHLVTVMQACLFDKDLIISKLKEQKILNEKPTELELKLFNERFNRAKYWLEKYADERVKFSVLSEPDCSIVKTLPKEMCTALSTVLSELPDNYSRDEITQFIYEYSKKNNIKTKEFFKVIYMILLGKKAGPRAGTLIEVIGKEKVRDFIKTALECF